MRGSANKAINTDALYRAVFTLFNINLAFESEKYIGGNPALVIAAVRLKRNKLTPYASDDRIMHKG